MVPTSCTGRTIVCMSREEALHKFWRAERDAGADAVTACERMGDFAARLDAERAADLATLKSCMERTR